MIDDANNVLKRAVACTGGIRLRVSATGDHKAELHQIVAPFAVVGRSTRSDVRLTGSGVSYRHVYLQMLAGRVFCVDLGSKAGLYWGRKRRSFGWLAPRETLRVGSQKLMLDTDVEPTIPSTAPVSDDEIPLNAGCCRVDELPGYRLEVWDGSDTPVRVPIDRVVSLVGRWESCPVYLADESVSRVHCSLVLTKGGLWVVDLLGKEGIKVNQSSKRAALLEHGDQIRIGRFTIRVHMREILDDLPGRVEDAQRTDPALQVISPEPAGHPAVAAASAQGVEQEEPAQKEGWTIDSDWLGTLFKIDHLSNALVVLPNISAGSFRYSQLQAESNALRRKIEEKPHQNLIVDLQGLNYIGSEVIGVVIGLARRATDRGGRVALCHASTNVIDVMQNMGLLRLWPYFNTRDEAAKSLNDV